jgi:malonate transporter MadL subunit
LGRNYEKVFARNFTKINVDMVIYGVAVLAACYLLGQLIGETLGRILHIDANVGGVGFAMLLLILVSQWMHKKKWTSSETDNGVLFWSKMYIPVIVAMSATQNVTVALSGGLVAILAGILPVVICFLLIPFFTKFSKKQNPTDGFHQ